MNRKPSVLLAFAIAFAGHVPAAVAQGNAACGSLENGYGPYDYRTDKGYLDVVERAHFTPEVESLLRGSRSVLIGADIDYTLRAFPNHHRALMSMMNLARRENAATPRGARYSMECWFVRAERFRPDDAMVKVIHGLYMIASGKPREAVVLLDAARELDSRDANVHYNLGLAYLDLGQHDKALDSAHRAYAAGFPLPGLRDRLKRSGKWREPAPATPQRGTAAEQGAAGRASSAAGEEAGTR